MYSLDLLAFLSTSKRPLEDSQDVAMTDAPPRKRVRFCPETAPLSSEEEAEMASDAVPPQSQQDDAQLSKLMARVRRRAERRRRKALRSPPPPAALAAAVSPEASSSSSDDDVEQPQPQLSPVEQLQRKLQRMQRAICQSAAAELQLLNKSKRLRDKRAKLTASYESLAQQFVDMQQTINDDSADATMQVEIVRPPFVMQSLPPLFSSVRRVSNNSSSAMQDAAAKISNATAAQEA